MATPQTLTYKTVGSLPINLDLYLPPNSSTTPLSILVWFHGGGLLQGTRSSVSPHMLDGVSKHNYALVSADYRLAPQVPLSEIVSDVQDCLKFVAEELPQKVATNSTSPQLDTTRIVVSGSSAGGYLALLAGLSYPNNSGVPVPPIKAILAIYPITNPFGQFFTTPQPIPSDAYVDESDLSPFLDRNAEVVAGNSPDSLRNKFYFYMMRKAKLAELLSLDKGDETYLVAHRLRELGKGKGELFPPTYVVHGDADRFVGVEQAEEVVEALKETGVEFGYEKLSGADHLFDKDPSVTMEGMYTFMKKHIG